MTKLQKINEEKVQLKIVKKDFHAQLSKDLLKEQAECYEDRIIKIENKYEEKIDSLKKDVKFLEENSASSYIHKVSLTFFLTACQAI